MEKMESSFKVLSTTETDGKANQVSVKVYMTKQKQDYIKGLMFAALEDPRAKYKPITTDEMEADWKNLQGC
jgi:hypothetical protein